MDLPPETSLNGEYSSKSLTTERPTQVKLGRHFLDTPEVARIRQILIDSAYLNREIIGGEKVGMVFIDGAHTYEYVKKDTETALQLVNPGGYLVWHDYFVFHPDYGVRIYLHELAREMPVYRLCNSLVAVARVPQRV